MLTFKSGVRLAALIRAEGVDGKPAISEAHATAIQRALEAAGVEFTNGGAAGGEVEEGRLRCPSALATETCPVDPTALPRTLREPTAGRPWE